MATCESEEQCSTASTSTGEYIVLKSVSKVETSCERQLHMYVNVLEFFTSVKCMQNFAKLQIIILRLLKSNAGHVITKNQKFMY